jgi:hypothetical protein
VRKNDVSRQKQSEKCASSSIVRRKDSSAASGPLALFLNNMGNG